MSIRSRGIPCAAMSSAAEFEIVRKRERPRRDLAGAPHLAHVVVSMDVVDERDARRPRPQRGQERDPVHHLEHHVGIRHEPAPLPPDRARKHRRASADAVNGQVAMLLARRAARIAAGDH
jgi:hypothetical protein